MKEWHKQFDWLLIFCWGTLAIIGLIAIYSATQGPVSEFLPSYIQQNFSNQLTWIFISILVIILLQFTAPRSFQQISLIFYVVCLLLGIITVIWGTESGGATRWLVVGGLRIQVSEFMKLATILVVAQYLSSRRDISAEKLGPAITSVILMIIPAVIVLFQNDTGTALVMLSLIPVMLFWSGLPYGISLFIVSPAIVGYFAILNWQWGIIAAIILTVGVFLIQRRPSMTLATFAVGLLIVIGVQVALYQVLQPYQQARIEAFINPSMDPTGAGWNVLQAKTAIGSGGIFGKGFMEGTQTQLRFLPEQWTDFIFPVIAEEFGFIGAGFVIILFGILLLRLLNNAGDHKHPFAQLVMVGVAAILFMHLLINIGSATGLLPVIGLPLPFISYGGSSFLANSIMLGICLNFRLHQRTFTTF